MPAVTTCVDLPYPLDSDRIDVAKHIKDLAVRVDTILCGLEVSDLDNKYVNKTGDTMTGMLNLKQQMPNNLWHAVPKTWVDTNFVHVIGDTLTGPLLYGASVTNNELTSGNALTRRSWQMDTFLQRDGSNIMTGDLNMNGKAVIGIRDPPQGDHEATSKSYVLGLLAGYVEITGDRMTGALGVGTAPNSGNGWTIDDQGTAAAAHNANAVQLSLRKGPSADAVGQVWIRLERGAAPGTAVSSIQVGASQDRTLFTNLVVGAPSDYRLKEFVAPMSGALDKVRAIARKVYRGRWRESGVEADLVNAHELAEVTPYAVIGDKDGEAMQNVDFDSLMPLLIAAIGELAEKVEAA